MGLTVRDSLGSRSFGDWVRNVEDRLALWRTEFLGLAKGTEEDPALALAAGWYPELNPVPPAEVLAVILPDDTGSGS